MVSKVISGVVLIGLCSGCAVDGRLYTNKIVSYSEDFDRTPRGSKVCYIDDFKVKEPFSGYDVSAEWMTSSVYEQARNADIGEIYYADLKIFSVMFGIYSQKTLIIYGE